MKKLATLLLAAGMVVASNAPASAMDIKVDGFHMFTFESASTGFAGDNVETVAQRTRLGLKFTASENLSGYVQFQMGTDSWGDYAGKHAYAGYDSDKDELAAIGDKHGRYNVQTRQAYVDWLVPGTALKVRMGRQNIGLPGDAFGDSSVMSAGWGGRDGIAVAAPVADWLSLNALWVRAGVNDDTDTDTGANSDIFGLAANLKFNGFAVTPWVAYGSLDKDADSQTGAKTGIEADANAYWVGATFTLSYFDPFTLKLSAAYGQADYKGAGSNELDDKSGWNVQAKASYKTAFGTPAIGAWYASGDDEIEGDEKYGQGNMPHVKGRFMPTTSFHNGAYGLGGGTALEAIGGTAGLFAGIEGVSFVKDLTHYAGVTWIQGTNDKDNVWSKKGKSQNGYAYMTTDDSVVEFDFGTTYKIYKNLAANLELSYLINEFDEKTVGNDMDDDDWRIGLTFQYNF